MYFILHPTRTTNITVMPTPRIRAITALFVSLPDSAESLKCDTATGAFQWLNILSDCKCEYVLLGSDIGLLVVVVVVLIGSLFSFFTWSEIRCRFLGLR